MTATTPDTTRADETCKHTHVVAAGDHPCVACGQPCLEIIKLDIARRVHEERDSKLATKPPVATFPMAL